MYQYPIETTVIEVNELQKLPLNLEELVNLKQIKITIDLNILQYLKKDVLIFPENLEELYLFRCNLTSFEFVLPDSLIKLDISNNNITELRSLPKQLQHLNCNGNNLTKLPPLPETLIELDCGNNQIKVFPEFPSGLKYFKCEWGNPITRAGAGAYVPSEGGIRIGHGNNSVASNRSGWNDVYLGLGNYTGVVTGCNNPITLGFNAGVFTGGNNTVDIGSKKLL